MNNENNLNSYEVGESYQLMNDTQARPKFVNNLGLETQPDFSVVKNPCSDDMCRYPGIPPQVGFFYSNDGRMKDSRGMEIILDRPATVGFYGDFMKDTYDRSYKNYRSFYENYNDMNNAQIQYYVDKSISQPFFGPVYTLSSNVDKTIFVDPMDSNKPQYYKTPISNTLNSVSADQSCRDQLFFRENLMASQQNLYNRTSWINRWISPMS